jgi:hypothetical protein
MIYSIKISAFETMGIKHSKRDKSPSKLSVIIDNEPNHDKILSIMDPTSASCEHGPEDITITYLKNKCGVFDTKMISFNNYTDKPLIIKVVHYGLSPSDYIASTIYTILPTASESFRQYNMNSCLIHGSNDYVHNGKVEGGNKVVHSFYPKNKTDLIN